LAEYLIERLRGHHPRAAFTCGVEPLDRYLRQQAGQDARRRVAAPFALIEAATGTLVGYYTLAAAAVRLDELPAELVRRAPLYPSRPATLIGRLAVDERHRGRGIGERLLFDALARAVKQSAEVASYAVVVDAKDEAARRFYERYGFVGLASAGNRLLLPMATVAQRASE
jgi:GNAT superfamily N-acetyltransferase